MSKYLVFFLFLLLHNNPKEESILWSEGYRLQWTDFKGEPKNDSEAVAITASGLSVGLTAKTLGSKLIDYKAIIEAHFYPHQSWYLKDQVNNIVLAHEQLHFDITELYARKLRKRIEQYNFSINIKKELSHLQKQINKELKMTQEKYDAECDFSRNPEAQKNWRILVNQELKKLSKYSLD